MVSRNSFVSYILDILDDFGPLRAKAMFGGFGIYCNDIFFAIVVDDLLYIKADDKNRKLFEDKGLPRLSYNRKGKKCYMSYYLAPEEAIEDKDELYFWVSKGYKAALRSKKG